MNAGAGSSAQRTRAARTAVLLVQLGTPDEPTPRALRSYLREFLSDRRVVEIPRALWAPILHGIVLRLRPSRSARKYASIWTDEGSPLLVYTKRQAMLLRGSLGARGHDVDVAFAMRYGNPSIGSVLRELRERGAARLLVLPMYPQYAGATTATAVDEIAREFARWRDQPELRIVRDFHDDEGYVDALVQRVRACWQRDGRGERLLMSFHGMPRRCVALGDPYESECRRTAQRLAERLGLDPGQWLLTFQSRFGRAQWLQPYTAPTLQALARDGVRSVDVVCPGFVADCLETLEEIAIEGRKAFLDAGGETFRYIPALNDSAPFVAALADLAERHLLGWRTHAAGERT